MKVVPPEKSTCYLKVFGSTVNRYTISVGLRVDPRAIPEPLQEELEVLPKWWDDPEPYRMFERERYFVVNVGRSRRRRHCDSFCPDGGAGADRAGRPWRECHEGSLRNTERHADRHERHGNRLVPFKCLERCRRPTHSKSPKSTVVASSTFALTLVHRIRVDGK